MIISQLLAISGFYYYKIHKDFFTEHNYTATIKIKSILDEHGSKGKVYSKPTIGVLLEDGRGLDVNVSLIRYSQLSIGDKISISRSESELTDDISIRMRIFLLLFVSAVFLFVGFIARFIKRQI